MKIKQLLLSFLTLSVLLVSCSKENILGSDIAPINNMEHATMSTSSGGEQTPLLFGPEVRTGIFQGHDSWTPF